jgi:hypothetical protein
LGKGEKVRKAGKMRSEEGEKLRIQESVKPGILKLYSLPTFQPYSLLTSGD